MLDKIYELDLPKIPNDDQVMRYWALKEAVNSFDTTLPSAGETKQYPESLIFARAARFYNYIKDGTVPEK